MMHRPRKTFKRPPPPTPTKAPKYLSGDKGSMYKSKSQPPEELSYHHPIEDYDGTVWEDKQSGIGVIVILLVSAIITLVGLVVWIF